MQFKVSRVAEVIAMIPETCSRGAKKKKCLFIYFFLLNFTSFLLLLKRKNRKKVCIHVQFAY